MSLELSGSMVFDTGVLVELALDSRISRDVRDGVLAGQIQPLSGELNVAELGYVLCRRLGREQALRSIQYLRRANQVRILASSSFLDQAAEMKCIRSMSLVDCVTIAMGESLALPVLFARREKELFDEMKKKPYKTNLLFIEKNGSH